MRCTVSFVGQNNKTCYFPRKVIKGLSYLAKMMYNIVRGELSTLITVELQLVILGEWPSDRLIQVDR